MLAFLPAQEDFVQREYEQHLPQVDPRELGYPAAAVQQREQRVAQHARLEARSQEGDEPAGHAQTGPQYLAQIPCDHADQIHHQGDQHIRKGIPRYGEGVQQHGWQCDLHCHCLQCLDTFPGDDLFPAAYSAEKQHQAYRQDRAQHISNGAHSGYLLLSGLK